MSTTLLVKVDRDIGDETDATQFGQRYSVRVVTFYKRYYYQINISPSPDLTSHNVSER